MKDKMSTSTKIKLLAATAGTLVLITPKLHALDYFGYCECLDQAESDSLYCVDDCISSNPAGSKELGDCFDRCDNAFFNAQMACYAAFC